jgi:methyl-accepting chemotaxis protein
LLTIKRSTQVKIKNIRTRLLILLLPLIFVILAGLSGASYYISKQALTQSVNETAASVGTDYSYRVKSDIEVMLAQLDGLSNMPDIRAGADKEQMVRSMAEAKKRLGNFDVITYIALDGAGINDGGQTVSYSDRDYFKQVVETKQSVISDPIKSKATGKLAIVLAVPVMNQSQLTGVVIGTFSMERLSNMIKDMKFLATGYGQISDNSGVIIAHPKQPDLVGKLNIAEKKINPELKLEQTELDDALIDLFKKAAQSGKQVAGTYSFVDGVKRVAVFSPINLSGGQEWVLTVAAPEKEGRTATDHLALIMLFISLVCLVAAVIAIIFIAARFTQPITAFRDECLLLAEGDLRERTSKITSEDEFGQLANGFHDMRKNLRQLVGKVHSQAEQLAASSEELTASAEQSAQAAAQIAESITSVAEGAEEQLKAADNSTAVVEEMSANFEEAAATGSQVAAQSALTANKAKEGETAVANAVKQMASIEQTVNASAKVVKELGKRSKEIGQIVEAISGIANQTNLLALNAAIEAARAGEHGRGFAVVAEEVRKLAEQSEMATKQITALISVIQADTEKAVSAMDSGTKEVIMGTEAVNTAGQAFAEITALVLNVSDQVQGITKAIDTMALDSQHIVGAVTRIDELSKKATGEAQTVSAATEEQSASMQQVAASSQSLATSAMELRDAVSKFRV